MPKQREHFDSYLEPKSWVWEWQASNTADLMTSSKKIKELIKKMMDEQARLLTPQQEKDIFSKCRGNNRYKSPYHFLVSDISEKAYNIIAVYPIMSTPDISAFFLAYNPSTPCFLYTIKGFTLSIKTPDAIQDSEKVATNIVRRTLVGDKSNVTLLKSKLIGDNTSQHNKDLAVNILQNLEVWLVKEEDMVDCSAIYKPRKLTWNVFFWHQPLIN